MTFTPNEMMILGSAIVGGLGLMFSDKIEQLWNASPVDPLETKVKTENQDWLTLSLSEADKKTLRVYLESVQKASPNADYRLWFSSALEGKSIPQVMFEESQHADASQDRTTTMVPPHPTVIKEGKNAT